MRYAALVKLNEVNEKLVDVYQIIEIRISANGSLSNADTKDILEIGKLVGDAVDLINAFMAKKLK